MTLPIEVVGAPPHTESVTLVLPAGGGAEATNLQAQAHNVSYRDKGRVRVNGGPWFTLWNDVPAIKVAEPGKSYGGFGGGFSTVNFTIGTPDVTFVDGDNTIEFQYFYKHVDHATAGYRIIRLDIIDEAGDSLLPVDSFRFDDPSTWTPPHDNPADIAAGRAIWTSAPLDPMTVSCMDCHAEDGRDLKYFNISNKVIIEQCKKSGFTQREGEQVASYIRSLPFTPPAQARPWNPPYQPGPGTDSRPVFEWAAGAGLDAVLESDAEMLPYLFGTGTQAEIDAVTDMDSDLNLREMPIAVQFPDWIHWIPRTHPSDVWGKEYWEGERAEHPAYANRRNPHESYQYLLDQFKNNNLANSSNLVRTVDNQFQNNVFWWIGDGQSFGFPWTDLEGKIIDRAKSRGFTAAEAKLNLSRWRAVKLWEMFHTYGAEDKAINNISTAEKYQWPTNAYAVFQFAAHFIGDDRGTSIFAWESLETGTYFSSIWYQLQMVLNSGMRQGAAVRPVDWAYNFYHVNRLGKRTGVYEPLRLVQNLIKCYQQRHRPGEAITKEVWSMREVSPWRHYSDFDGDLNTYALLDSYDETGQLRQRILRSMLQRFLEGARDYEPSEWPRTDVRATGGDYWFLMESEDYIPVEEPDEVTRFFLFSVNGERDAVEADAMYRLIPRLYESGMEPALVNDLADWCADMWPLADWQARATDSDADGLHDYWEGINFNSLAGGPNDDPNLTGVTNREAYYFGQLPNRSRTGFDFAMAMNPADSSLSFHYERPLYPAGSNLIIESSVDLKQWNPATAENATVNPVDSLYESVTERFQLPSENSNSKKIFYRLKLPDSSQ